MATKLATYATSMADAVMTNPAMAMSMSMTGTCPSSPKKSSGPVASRARGSASALRHRATVCAAPGTMHALFPGIFSILIFAFASETTPKTHHVSPRINMHLVPRQAVVCIFYSTVYEEAICWNLFFDRDSFGTISSYVLHISPVECLLDDLLYNLMK
jgi:hypothetical protein